MFVGECKPIHLGTYSSPLNECYGICTNMNLPSGKQLNMNILKDPNMKLIVFILGGARVKRLVTEHNKPPKARQYTYKI